MKLSIVIPVFNNSIHTNQCLSNLNDLPDDYEIIVVDNNSTDDTQDIIKNYPRVKCLKNNKNEGFAKACNSGYKASSGKYVMFLNNDIKVRNNFKTWPEELIKHADNKIVGPTGGLLHSDFNFITETKKIINSKYFYMSGWCLVSSRKIWDQLTLAMDEGPFSTEFGLAFFEDTDLSFRAKEAGIPFEIVAIPVHHFGHQTARKMDINKLYMSAKEIFRNKWKNRIASLK